MSDKDMVMAAASLSRAAPQAWDAFMLAITDYTESRCVECIQAPPTMLQVAQGRAQSMVALLRLLDDCRKTAESIDKNNKR